LRRIVRLVFSESIGNRSRSARERTSASGTSSALPLSCRSFRHRL
jgi:hypothetical protein